MIKSRIMRGAGHVAPMGEERCIQGFGVWWGDLRESDNLEEQGLDGNHNIKMDLQEVGCGGLDCIDLVQDRDRWRALVNAVMSLWVS